MENFEKPIRRPADKKEDKEKEKVEWTPEEGQERIVIEREFVQQLESQNKFQNKEERDKWLLEHAKELAKIIDDRKEDFLKLHKTDPGALFAIISQLIEGGE